MRPAFSFSLSHDSMLHALHPASVEEPALAALVHTILIVDDDADMRLYLEGCLRRVGDVQVHQAANGPDGLRLARALRPDLVVSDVVMPGFGGLELCRALRADAETEAIPLLLISGEARAHTACADGFLPKPFNAAAFRAQVDRLLNVPPPDGASPRHEA